MAATPGLGPHEDVFADALPELLPEPLLELVVALEAPPPDPGGALVVLPLLPQAASSTAPMTTARATPKRTRSA
ncbi:MAG: hypothetical protein ACRDPA_07025 [Solirubrobacteraceae bacterium]